MHKVEFAFSVHSYTYVWGIRLHGLIIPWFFT